VVNLFVSADINLNELKIQSFSSHQLNLNLKGQTQNHDVLFALKGGADTTIAGLSLEEDGEDYLDLEDDADFDPKTALWLLNQMHLFQARTALLAKELRKTGHLTGLSPIIQEERVNKLEIALSTEDQPMPCRIYFNAEDGAKVVAPCKCKGSQKWISWSALNQQYRNEPEKWKSCSVCRTQIDYAQYQRFASSSGQLLSKLLEKRGLMQLAIVASAVTLVAFTGLVFQGLVIRFLLSGVLWQNYDKLLRIIYAPLPLQIVILQFAYKYVKKGFDAVEKKIRDHLIEWESASIENALPITFISEEE